MPIYERMEDLYDEKYGPDNEDYTESNVVELPPRRKIYIGVFAHNRPHFNDTFGRAYQSNPNVVYRHIVREEDIAGIEFLDLLVLPSAFPDQRLFELAKLRVRE